MKTIFLLTFLFLGLSTFAQTQCAIGKIENSNRILYNEFEIEKIIDLKKYNAIFYGESHIRDFEPEFKINFIKHLNRIYGVRDVFMEIGYSAAYFYNQYLLTGDTTILTYNKSMYSVGKYKTFWKDLFEYNKLNTDSLKIKIHGIDFERTEAFKLFDILKISNISIPEHLSETFNKINSLTRDKSLFAFDNNFQIEFSKIKSIFKKNEKEIKIIYGENFSIIHSVLNNNVPITSKVKPRNKVWLDNISRIIIENKIKKIVCFFGAAHTNYENATSLTNTIKGIDNFKDSVLNIKGIYNHFFSYGQMTDSPRIFEYAYKEKELYEKYANQFCRATIISTSNCVELHLKNKVDFLLFAKDIVLE